MEGRVTAALAAFIAYIAFMTFQEFMIETPAPEKEGIELDLHEPAPKSAFSGPTVKVLYCIS